MQMLELMIPIEVIERCSNETTTSYSIQIAVSLIEETLKFDFPFSL